MKRTLTLIQFGARAFTKALRQVTIILAAVYLKPKESKYTKTKTFSISHHLSENMNNGVPPISLFTQIEFGQSGCGLNDST